MSDESGDVTGPVERPVPADQTWPLPEGPAAALPPPSEAVAFGPPTAPFEPVAPYPSATPYDPAAPFASAAPYDPTVPFDPFAPTGHAAQRPPRRTPVVVGAVAGVVVLALVAASAGAVISHEVWGSSGSASTAQGSTAVPGTGGSGSTDPFGGESPFGSGSGSSGSQSGQSPFGLTPFGGSSGSGSSSSGGGASAGTGAGGPADAAAIAAKIDPALVDVNSTLGYQDAESAGTGIVLTSDGEVLTNNHVIDGATRVTVTDVGNHRTYDATVVGYSPTSDLAVLQLKNASGLTTASLGDSSTAAVGEAVVAVGNAGGSGGTPSEAGGSITALDQSITASDESGGTSEKLSGLIETNADVQPGDSGGSLVNTSGQVVGIDTAASVGYSFQDSATQGYAIPIDTALATAQQIESGVASTGVHIGPSAFLGVSVSLAGTGSGSGALIQGVIGGAAQNAGIVAGDVVTAVDDHTITSATDLGTTLLLYHPGDHVTIQWTDASGQVQRATVVLGTGPSA